MNDTYGPVENPVPGEACVPSCVIYTRKRDGRYKARLVALGNRMPEHMRGSDNYAPTVSYPAVRMQLIDAAACGKQLLQADVEN